MSVVLTLIARIRILEGKKDETKSYLKTFVPQLLMDEPGTLTYIPYFSKDEVEGDLVIFYEQYQDEAALKIHRENLKAHGQDFVKIFDLQSLRSRICEDVL